MNKKLVYICSPCRGDYKKNIQYAEAYSRRAIRMGYIPITPHIYFTRFLNDNNIEERSMGMDAGLQLLRMCSEIWVFGLDKPSEGMQAEIAFAIRHGIPIRDGMKMIRHEGKKTDEKNHTEEKKTAAKKFTPLKDMFENATLQHVTIKKEGDTCQTTTITKAIRILPRAKR